MGYRRSVIRSAAGHLTHPVLAVALGGPGDVLGLELIGDPDVEVAPVLRIGADVEAELDLLAVLDGKDVLKVEDGLLPVSVLGVGAGGEADGLVAGGEVDVEPRDKGVDEVVTLDGQVKFGGEGQVGNGASVEIEGEDRGGVGYDGLDVDGINEGLGQSRGLQGSIVEAVDIVPDW